MTPEQEKQYAEVFDEMARGITAPLAGHASKPPIGVMPESVWRQQRVQDLANAIGRYAEDGLLLPIVAEWACEISRLINEYPDATKRSGRGD